ncbi:MAG TPA: PIG-L deacetylase family protein [Candidatus Saccharimonadales bacterium]|nr:PIG-L deacetylase family protein [Candidatus Saccharimonadales bacterium]
MSHPIASAPANQQPFELGAATNVLFVHAHPDDESVATGAAIELFVRQGHNVHLAIATDGQRSTKGDPTFVASGGRRRECQAACGEVLGVAEDRQVYFALPDGELAVAHNQIRLAIRLGAYMVQNGVKHIVTPGIEGFDGHPDHIATHRSALLASAVAWLCGHRVLVWALRPGDSGEVSVAVDYTRKQSALNHYVSQFSNDPETRAAQLASYHHLMHVRESYSRVPVWRIFSAMHSKKSPPKIIQSRLY